MRAKLNTVDEMLKTPGVASASSRLKITVDLTRVKFTITPTRAKLKHSVAAKAKANVGPPIVPSQKKVNLILDSGAFSAWKKGLKIDVHDYIDFINHKKELFCKAVNLDQIPGSWGRVPSPTEVEQSASVGWDNLMTMRKEGIEAMPVFHMGERKYWLDKMIGEGYDWIGISPANDRTTAQKKVWLDEIFTYLCGDKGYPQVRTHGFGVTALPIIFRYPWGTIDSTTWLLQPSYGKILVPMPTPDGGYDFTRAPQVISVAETREGKEPSAQSLEHGQHILTVGKTERAYIERYVKDMGCDMEKLVEHFMYRCQLSAIFFIEMEKRFTSARFKPVRDTLFCDAFPTPHGLTEAKWPHVMTFFTVPTSSQHSWALTQVNGWNRLITYFYFMNGDNRTWDWRYYVETGIVHVDNPRNGRKMLRI